MSDMRAGYNYGDLPAPRVIEKPSADSVNHPQHYQLHPSGVECIVIAEAFNFNLGNVIKYVWRALFKNGVEDLKKARWYLDREIARVERSEVQSR